MNGITNLITLSDREYRLTSDLVYNKIIRLFESEMNGITNLITLSDHEYRLISDLVYNKIGINLGKHKKSLIVGRLQKLLKEEGFSNFSQYYDHVISDQTNKALNSLIERISTNHTFFYRENDHFSFFKEKVLPPLTEMLRKRNTRDLRIWSAACSSGEEAYTLAMLLMEFFGNEITSWKSGILATDISDRVLDKAKKGIYSDDNVSKMPKKLKYNYFCRLGDGQWIVKDIVKKMVLFRRLNLMRERFPFKGKFHVIFCRNVMIYFDKPTRNALVHKLYDCTEQGGFLLIGHSESLTRSNCPYTSIEPAIYRKEAVR